MHGLIEVQETILLTNMQRSRNHDVVRAHVDARASTFSDSPGSPDVALFVAGLLSEKDALGVVDATLAVHLKADAKTAADSGYVSSPTLVVNGRYRLVGGDAMGYLKVAGRPSTWRWLEDNP